MKVGNTPLNHNHQISSWAGINTLHLKDETKNPSGSFKDRGSLSAFTHHIQSQNGHKKPIIGTVSTGNMAISTAWMGGQFGQRAFVVVNETIDEKKIRIITAAAGKVGVDIFKVKGNYSKFHRVVKEACEKLRHEGTPIFAELTDDYHRIVGYSTVFKEIVDQVGQVDFVFIPGASGALFQIATNSLGELKNQGLITNVPRVVLVQEMGGDAICQAFQDGKQRVSPIKLKDSLVAKAIAVSNARSGDVVLPILAQGHHLCVSVTTQEIKAAQAKLIDSGFFIQPASAASLAAAKKLRREGRLLSSDKVVCVLTGGQINKRIFVNDAGRQASIINCDLAELFEVLITSLSKP